jgi:hypothetical protein
VTGWYEPDNKTSDFIKEGRGEFLSIVAIINFSIRNLLYEIG